MRLDKIKIAGFKSFVDPTSIPLPGNLVGIVGPNGCGKSNIIDAVRWVMGESSAKHLRGESMADVIFNGSSSRKPVGLATVELIFDNSEGKLAGEYAQYQQISVKRQVSRDGQSNYYLNGTRCRRKDITDIFLGTGLGPRSYAIIEQGTISRLIEAKPEELRGVIEEAAGISRYKERRHETEIRMRHTRENLERLQDLIDEVEKQLANLQRQAKKAEKYTNLKADERLHKEQLLGLRWRKYDQLLEQHRQVLQECEQIFKELVSEDNALIATLEQKKSLHEIAQKNLNNRQGEYYLLGSEISRLDQIIRHANKTREDQAVEQERLRSEQSQALEDLEHDQEQIETISEKRLSLEAEKELAEASEIEAAENKVLCEQALKDWRSEWETFKEGLSRYKSQSALQQANIKQREEQHRQLHARQQRFRLERDELEGLLLHEELEALQESLEIAEEQRAAIQANIDELNIQAKESRHQAKLCQDELNALRTQLQSIQGQIASLELLQKHAMGKDQKSSQNWLDKADLTRASRLAEHIEVSPGWEAAVETVLGIHLQSICVEDPGQYRLHLLDGSQLESLAFFETHVSTENPIASSLKRLLSFVESKWNLNPLLSHVYCADDLPEAYELCAALKPHESIVTPDGIRLGPGWLVIDKPEDGKAGVLKRGRDLRDLHERRDSLRLKIETLENNLEQAEESIREAEFEREHKQKEINRIGSEISQLKAQLSAATAKSEQAQKRIKQLDMEQMDLEELLLQNNEEMAEAHALLQQAEQNLKEFEDKTEAMELRQDELEQNATTAEQTLRAARDRGHHLKSQLDTLISTEALTLKHLERVQSHYQQSSERLDDLIRRMGEASAPNDEEKKALDEHIQKRKNLEAELADLRGKVSEIETEIRSLNEQRMRKERDRDNLKAKLEQTKLDFQANEVRRQTIQEQFEELDSSPEAVVPTLPEQAEEKEWQRRVSDLAEEIARLGAINLTAVEEFKEQSERMATLAQQHADLTESLETLQQAIEKIDKECKTRFKETFDKVNAGMQRMFPKLFGGGQAYLELNERDLLEAGVSVMARPPGKRNSTIHLLSGGEKALTAVSLVFSIFELNPAPFCLLDEVDAPLDEANVGRFSQLVKEMSESVQFMFISHNKVTMEIAQHLAGVTMREPGVSRIVAVDIDEAVKLAAL